MLWFNFRTHRLQQEDPADWMDIIPPVKSVQDIYKSSIVLGKEPRVAAYRALTYFANHPELMSPDKEYRHEA
jgi:hypothetical protein